LFTARVPGDPCRFRCEVGEITAAIAQSECLRWSGLYGL
jgi:hypothetical protein